MPIGNLTSQLFSNIYLNELDQFAKHKLKAKYYIRYADDFIFISENKEYLENIISEVEKFLESKLKLQLHPNKVLIKTLYSGVDFLGWVNFFDHRIIRGKTRERMFRRITNNFDKETLNSYLGY